MSEGTVLHSTTVSAVELGEHLHIMQPERMHEGRENSQQEIDEVNCYQDDYAYDDTKHRELGAILCSTAEHWHYDIECQLISGIGKTHRRQADGQKPQVGYQIADI